MAKFKLLGGSADIFGTRYKRGDIVDCDVDLCVLFPNRFSLVTGEIPARKSLPVAPPVQIPVEPKVVPAPEAVAMPSPVEIADPPAAKTPHKKPAPAPVSKGREVTKNFKKAMEEDFQVFKQKDGFYYVYDTDSPDVVLNQAGLKKTEVTTFITSHLES